MTKTNKSFLIGTRGSVLALWQAKSVATGLDIKTKLEIVKTSGDRFLDTPLQGQTETGFFTKEIENQLLLGNIDIAVHSLKDLPTRIHQDLTIAAYLKRGPVPDLLLVHPEWHSQESVIPVKKNCKVGATSLRRKALLSLYGPHAKPAMLRGNVPTRVRKCREGQYGAIILAQAGLERLKLDTSPLHIYSLCPEIWLTAPGQGIIAIQTRKDDSWLIESVRKLDHEATRIAAEVERQLLANFEGGCHVAFGSYAKQIEEGWQTFIGLDQPGLGWMQTVVTHNNIQYLKKIMPDDLEDFRTIKVEKKEMLCRTILL